MKGISFLNSVPDLTLLASLVLAVVLDLYFPVARIVAFPANLVGWLVICVGVAGIAIVITTLRTKRTSTNPVDMPSSFLTTGLFSMSRNPLYLSYILLVLGLALLLGSLTAFLAPLLCFLVIRLAIVPIEERRLREGFGDAYRIYCEKVRRWV